MLGKDFFQKIKNIPSEWLVIFALGFLLGIVVKTEAAKRVTMGFDDGKTFQQGFDISGIQNKLLEKAEKQNDSQNEENVVPAAGELDN